jgi:KUP system potassium uptake protein
MTTSAAAEPRRSTALIIGAIGVVYGDIGTSPLYMLRTAFTGEHGLALTSDNVYGVLSVVFWALVVVVTLKYIMLIMRADNNGEGGILALTALVSRGLDRNNRRRWWLIGFGIFGAAMFYGDGMITPAISVLSAVEGLEIVAPALHRFVVPVTLVIIVALFAIQKRGTASVGLFFGPVMCIYFVVLALLGTWEIVQQPAILTALNPYFAAAFFLHAPVPAFMSLGAVVLAVTGTEALYADMGHFGKSPIRRAWLLFVMPALVLNYFGQGALLLAKGPAADANPFYLLAPPQLVYPLVALATAAAIIASQALISGAFSLAQQAVQLGYSPRLTIVHTSHVARGQIYVPEVNAGLMVACCGLVLAFQKSTNLAAAYGIAVVGTMAVTTVLLYAVARERWGWSVVGAGLLTTCFLSVDVAFLLSNVTKVRHGGWVPIVVGGIIFTVMTTWKRGRGELAAKLRADSFPIEFFMADLPDHMPVRVSGTAVFMTSDPSVTPVVLLHHYKHNKVLHERVILLSVRSEAMPFVPSADKVRVRDLGSGFFQVVAHYGFMQTPNVPEILRLAGAQGLKVTTSECSFFLGRETLLTTGQVKMLRWRKALFAFLSRNARSATAFFGIPPNRVLELGTQIEL